ncbi:hypothetical protein CC86DRAFT_371254 [Ophiobolus disseminans]|uniref:Ubiquitin 3 binding protein But2 C-terminal domain-containing protein n=1 Tax=Ophiobolus disseminans TaxID=1469910 RepID=A0A6A6ZV48_9PLEO|nr:hypothetical protein CC86DRAFT_371254 [Ophiobolus disseminans]
MLLSLLVSALSLATPILSTPTVTPRLLSPRLDCAFFPPGASMIVVDSADHPAINGLFAQPIDIIFPSKILPLLAIDTSSSRSVPRRPFACSAGQIAEYLLPRRKLGICQDRFNGHILLDAPVEKVLVPELYKHVAGGVELEGLYLGVKGQTTWGFRYTNATGGTREYFEVKVLGLLESEWDTVGNEIEFEGFLKVVEWV